VEPRVTASVTVHLYSRAATGDVPSELRSDERLGASVLIWEGCIRGNDGPGVDGPGIDGPGVDGPGVDGPGIDGPGVDGPGIDGPGVDVLPVAPTWIRSQIT
jgi:hypothetical protein